MTTGHLAVLGDKVKERCGDAKLVGKFRRDAAKQIDRNMEFLQLHHMAERPFFNREPFRELAGLDPEEIKTALKKSDAMYLDQVYGNNPDYVAMMLVVRGFVLQRNERMVNFAAVFAACCMYAMLHRHYYRLGFGDETTMEWVANNVSLKFDIRRLRLLGTLRKIAEGNHRNAKRKLTTRNDQYLIDYIANLRTRINGFVKTFAHKFYEAFDQRQKVEVTTSGPQKGGEDGEEFYPDRASDSEAVVGAANAFAMYMATNPVDANDVRVAAGLHARVSENSLRKVVEQAKTHEADAIDKLAKSVFALHLSMTKRSLEGVCNTRWIPVITKICSGSNVRNPNVLNIKSAVSDILTRRFPTFTRTRQEKTKTSYRHALLFYFLMVIQRQRCG